MILIYPSKGLEALFLNDPLCKDGSSARFPTVPLKAMYGQECIRYSCFVSLKSLFWFAVSLQM